MAEPKPKKHKGLIITAIVVVVLAVAGVGMYQWHEHPSFCSTMCHIEQTYVDNYSQEKGVVGTDKYGNEVSNTNAMMAVLHSHNNTTGKNSTIECVDCHEPNMTELATDGMHYVAGDYYLPRTERDLGRMMKWDGKEGTQFCVNENCHAYLRGSDGLVDYNKLEKTTIEMEFNPHSQHHGDNIRVECGECHKGHRASTVVCSGCHNASNPDIPSAVLPDGWVSYQESQQILEDAHAN